MGDKEPRPRYIQEPREAPKVLPVRAPTRDPHRSLQQKIADRRETLGDPSSLSPPRKKAIPMMEVQVARQNGHEKVAMVDVLALRCRSRFGEGAHRQSVKQLMELQRHQDRQQRL